MSSTLSIQVWHDGQCVQEVPFSGDKMQIGRLPENDLVINHLSVSRNHAVLEREGDRVAVADLGSQNGIWVDGARLSERMWLSAGGSLRIGQHEIRILGNAGELAAPNVEAAPQLEPITGGTGMMESSEPLAASAPSDPVPNATETTDPAVSGPSIVIEGAAPNEFQANPDEEPLEMGMAPMPDVGGLEDLDLGASPQTDLVADAAEVVEETPIALGQADGPAVEIADPASVEGEDLFVADEEATSLMDLANDDVTAEPMAPLDANDLFEASGQHTPEELMGGLNSPETGTPDLATAAEDAAGDLLDDFGPVETPAETDAASSENTDEPSLDPISEPEDMSPMGQEGAPEIPLDLMPEPLVETSDVAAPMYPGLRIQRSGQPEQVVAWDQAELCAGRGSDCEVVLGEPEVSRRHALFVNTGEQFEVRDLGSINGVYVNDVKVESKALQVGDVIRIESFTLTFLQESEPIGAAEAAPDATANEVPGGEQRHMTVIGELPPMGADPSSPTGTASELPALDLVEEAFDELDPDAKEDSEGAPMRLELEVSLEQLPEGLRRALAELGDATLEIPVRLKVRS